jgi:hypothetical protein
METFASKKGVSVYAYKGDAMTLLAFDLEKELTHNFVGFTIKVSANDRTFYLYNKMKFKDNIKLHRKPQSTNEYLSTEFSPIQKFRWIHVPSTIHFVDDPYFGNYTYEVTPRYVENEQLLPPDDKLTVTVSIEVSPFKDGDLSVGFTRSFISSQAFAYRFGNKLNLRPKNDDLTFNIKLPAIDTVKNGKKADNNNDIEYTYEEIHKYLGWQARDRVMEFLEEVKDNKSIKLDVFAYDLNEPVVVEILLALATQGRVRIILDDSQNHMKKGCDEMKFEEEFRQVAKNKDDLFRGHFGSLAHSKVLIQRQNKSPYKAIKVLTGSTNFTTNGLYINANHTLTFNKVEVAQLYADVFDASFGEEKMAAFKKSKIASTDFPFKDARLSEMKIRFSPHPAKIVDGFFKAIKNEILSASSDVLFAVMKDDSKSGILEALQEQVKSSEIFTAGITDVRDGMQLYKPGKKTGIRISGLKIATKLPKPFSDIIKTPGLGHNIHHKFVVVDFKGTDPVVYCGSSNLAYNPEQQNGDNLLEIRDKDVVTAFAIEAIRLTDHFSWLNKLVTDGLPEEEMFLYDNSEKYLWYSKYYDSKDLKYLERTLLMR